ncbi:MAG: hypothetical protein ISS23_00385 [Nanoarchaeota archaeon]|nr:hypothetical protein [Nanoarchaeota archaeon]
MEVYESNKLNMLGFSDVSPRNFIYKLIIRPNYSGKKYSELNLALNKFSQGLEAIRENPGLVEKSLANIVEEIEKKGKEEISKTDIVSLKNATDSQNNFKRLMSEGKLSDDTHYTFQFERLERKEYMIIEKGLELSQDMIKEEVSSIINVLEKAGEEKLEEQKRKKEEKAKKVIEFKQKNGPDINS